MTRQSSEGGIQTVNKQIKKCSTPLVGKCKSKIVLLTQQTSKDLRCENTKS